MKAVIFDLDQTLIDSRIAEDARKRRCWPEVYKAIPNFTAFPQIDELLASLRDSARLALVTSSPMSYCNRVIESFAWRFDVTVGYHDSANHKPHPEPFQVALRKLGLGNEDCVSVGDDPRDIIASRSAGIVSIGALWGSANPDELAAARPDFLCEDVRELRARLHSLGL